MCSSDLVKAPSNDPFQERFSMVFFIHPRSKDKLDPREHSLALTGGQARYPKATRWELLMERLADLSTVTPELLKELSESGLMERQIALNRASPDAMRKLKEHNLASDAVLKELKRIESARHV